MRRRSVVVLLAMSTASAGLGQQWTPASDPPRTLMPRRGHGMAFDSTRQVTVVVAGYRSEGIFDDKTFELDAVGWRATVPEPPRAGFLYRDGTAMAYDPVRGACVMFGGSGLADTWLYDGTSWTAGPQPPAGLTGRSAHAMEFHAGRGRVMMVGGVTASSAFLRDVWELAPSGWVQLPDLPAPARAYHAMVYDSGRGRLLLVGGNDFADTWEHDGTSWSSAAPLPEPRNDHGLAYDPVRAVSVLYGGFYLGNRRAEVFEYDGTAWVQRPNPPARVAARSGHRMVFDASRGAVVMFGGYAVPSYNEETWLYDGTLWTQGPPRLQGLIPRGAFGLVYDSVRSRLVAFGGADSRPHKDTWELVSGSWVPATPGPAAMPARLGHAMTYDPGRGRVVVFGGADDNVRFNDTWEYDGTAWSQGPAPPAALTPRYHSAFAMHPSRRRAVLYGGIDICCIASLDETWEFDGTAWFAGPPGPRPLFGAALAHHPVRDTLLLFGGCQQIAGGCFAETFTYDGTTWAPDASVAPGLEGRMGHSLSWDPGRGRFITYGGQWNGPGYLGDTWELGPGGWVPGAPAPALLLPSAFHQLVHDPASGRILMLGGNNAAWEIDSTGCAPIDVTPTSLPQAIVGTPYAVQLSASGGVAPYLFTVVQGSLPSGLALSPVGLLSGTPLAIGSSIVVIAATDASGCVGRRSYALVVVGPCGTISIDPPALPPGVVGQPYAQTLTASGGVGPYTFVVTAGGLPPGLLLLTSGVLAGTPTAPGPYPFTVTATDAAGCPGSRAYVLAVRPSGNLVFGQGRGAANPSRVRVYTASGIPTAVDFLAYGGSGWGVLAAGAVLDGTPTDQILTAPGPGPYLGPHVRGFRASGVAMGKVSFYAFSTSGYGAEARGANLDADGYEEILAAAGAGPRFSPHVRAFDYDGTSVRAIAKISFFAYAASGWGARVGEGDVDGDGYEEILTGPGPGPGLGSRVRGFQYDGATLSLVPGLDFTPYPYGYGVVPAGGDADADGFDEIAVAPGPGPAAPARFLGFNFDGSAISALPGFALTPYATFYGGCPAIDATGQVMPHHLLVGAGPDPAAASRAFGFTYTGTALTPLIPGGVVPFPGGFGVGAAGARLGL